MRKPYTLRIDRYSEDTVRGFVLSENEGLGTWSVRALRKKSDHSIPTTALLACQEEHITEAVAELMGLFPGIPFTTDSLMNTKKNQERAEHILKEAGKTRHAQDRKAS